VIGCASGRGATAGQGPEDGSRLILLLADSRENAISAGGFNPPLLLLPRPFGRGIRVASAHTSPPLLFLCRLGGLLDEPL
jgi:hypothetical protein